MSMDKRNYDTEKRSRADKAAVIRAVVAGYLVYLGFTIATNKNTDMSPALSRVLGGAFIVIALGFGFYIWKRWRSDVEGALLPEEDKAEAENASEE